MSGQTDYSQAVSTARDYYNSEDADNFYAIIWGGEDIHIGLYQSADEPIRPASRRTVEQMARKIEPVTAEMAGLDLGAGYGGSCRYLSKTYGCKTVALNLSEKENERDRQMNKEQGLDHLIEVIDGSFDSVPKPDASFDFCWSQDAILHSDDRQKVLAEVHRLLKPGGQFVFTDPMQADDAPVDKLQPIYDRIHLESLGSPGFYKEAGQRVGLEFVEFEDLTHQLPAHYARVKAELAANEPQLQGKVSPDYIERMKKGLQHWVDGGKAGYLKWGIFVFRKPA